MGTMEQAVTAGMVICAHPALENMLVRKWPRAKFQFDRSGNEWQGVLDLYRTGNCDVLAVGREDNLIDSDLMNQFCDEDLVFTDSLIVEVPIALPVSPEFVSGLSYWIFRGEKFHDVSIANSAKEYVERNGSPKCNVELANLGGMEETDDLTPLSPKNMVFPIIFFVGFALLAMLLQIIDERIHKKTGRHTLVGRSSTLDLFDDKATTNGTKGSMKTRLSKGLSRGLSPKLSKKDQSSLSDADLKSAENPGKTDALEAALAESARRGTFNLGESDDSQVGDYNGERINEIEHTSNNAALQELLASGAIDDALDTLSRLKQLKKLQ